MPFFKSNDVFAGRYQLGELMGEGDFSEVWTAKDQLVDDTMVVLKIYAAGKGMNEVGIHQYKQEYSCSQKTAHPHLLKILHFDIWDDIAFQVLPYYPVGTLGRMKEEGSFSERQVALVMSQIGSALAALHRQKPSVLHQDVKPDNIVISEPDHFLLANFGISNQPTETIQDATSGPKSITLAYSPPETFERFLKTDQSGDIFSLGVTLFEMCTKTLPWKGEGGKKLLKERDNSQVKQLPVHYSVELNDLLHACMSLNTHKRPGAEELHLKGKNFLETGQWNLPDKENREVSPIKRLKPYLLAACITAFFLMVGWAFFNSKPAVPLDKPQHLGASANKANVPEEDELLIDMLEYEKEHLAQRTQQLEEENRILLSKDSINTVLLKQQQQLLEENREEADKKVRASANRHERPKSPVVVSAPASNKIKADITTFLSGELERQLNKISDPELSQKDRTAWKNETLAFFSEDAVRILDETEGAPRQYSASIFLNLLFNVPHTIVVKEVKRDQNKKVTELRLSMRTKM